MITARLKTETKTSHQRLEKIIIGRIRQVTGIADYARLLEMFWCFYSPLENVLDGFIDGEFGLLYATGRKSGQLLQDIRSLGQAENLRAVCAVLPSVRNQDQALGAWYVLEGSALGGPHIAALLRNQAAIPDSAMSFFLGRGAETMEGWKKFSLALNDYAEVYGNEEEILRAAESTFLSFEEWAIEFYRSDAEISLALI